MLNPAQGIRFFQLLDSMVDFANARLGLDLRVGRDRAQRDPEKQSEVMRALCAHPEILREYVALNPSGFSVSLLKDAASWCEALDDRFPYCVRPNGDVELLFEDHIIELTGLSLEVDSMLKSDVGFVEACLLPFAGRIVYASAMAEYDMAIGAGLAKQFDAWFADARENGRIIRTADEYLTMVPLLKAQRDKREAQQLIEDTEYDLNPPTEFPGVHRSPLADMPFEERDACIEEEAWRILENFEGGALTIEKTLRKNCAKGERQIVRRHRLPSAADVSQARAFRSICMGVLMRARSKHALRSPCEKCSKDGISQKQQKRYLGKRNEALSPFHTSKYLTNRYFTLCRRGKMHPIYAICCNFPPNG